MKKITRDTVNKALEEFINKGGKIQKVEISPEFPLNEFDEKYRLQFGAVSDEFVKGCDLL